MPASKASYACTATAAAAAEQVRVEPVRVERVSRRIRGHRVCLLIYCFGEIEGSEFVDSILDVPGLIRDASPFAVTAPGKAFR